MWSFFYPMSGKKDLLPYMNLHGHKLDTPMFKPLGNTLGYYHAPSKTLLVKHGDTFSQSKLFDSLDVWDFYTDTDCILYLCRDGIYKSNLNFSGVHKLNTRFFQRASPSSTTMVDKTNLVLSSSNIAHDINTPGFITKTSAGYVIVVPFISLIDNSYTSSCFIGDTIDIMHYKHDYHTWDGLTPPNACMIQDGDFLYSAAVSIRNHKRLVVVSYDGGMSYGDAVIAGNEYYGDSRTTLNFLSNTPLVTRFIKPATLNDNLSRKTASENQPFFLCSRLANKDYISIESEHIGTLQSLISVALDFNVLGNGDDILPELGNYLDGCMGEDGLLYLTGVKNTAPGRYGSFVTWGKDLLSIIPGNGSVKTLSLNGEGTPLNRYLESVPEGDVFVSAKQDNLVLINHRLNGVWRNFIYPIT